MIYARAVGGAVHGVSGRCFVRQCLCENVVSYANVVVAHGVTRVGGIGILVIDTPRAYMRASNAPTVVNGAGECHERVL